MAIKKKKGTVVTPNIDKEASSTDTPKNETIQLTKDSKVSIQLSIGVLVGLISTIIVATASLVSYYYTFSHGMDSLRTTIESQNEELKEYQEGMHLLELKVKELEVKFSNLENNASKQD